jgi:hypothetical protein
LEDIKKYFKDKQKVLKYIIFDNIKENNLFPFYHFETERTLFSDDTYSMIGRALTFATYFESICKMFSGLIDVKLNYRHPKFSLENDQQFKKFLKYFERKRLCDHIKKISTYYNFCETENIISTLNKAKAARNFIAHELTLGIENIIEKDEGRKYIIEALTEYISKIAKANLILIILICFETHEEIPTTEYVKKYNDMILEWVLEIEE